jgi:hypothetical protein
MSEESDKKHSTDAFPRSLPGLLTESQQRHLESVLRYIEQSIADAERELDAEPGRGILHELRSNFDRRERERLRECIAHARDMLGTIADTFALEGNSRDVRRSIVARFSLLAIDARSATSHGLRSYGPVDDRLPAALDPLIEALARGLEAAVRNASG